MPNGPFQFPFIQPCPFQQSYNTIQSCTNDTEQITGHEIMHMSTSDKM